MPETAVVALLFTDVVGSTALGSRLGDTKTDELRRSHFGMLRRAIDANRGRLVKNLGDGVMAVFARPSEALSSAAAIQRSVTARPGALTVRIGLHVGEVAEEDGDYFGTAVAVAERICKQAAGGQILVSDVLRSLAATRGEHRFEDPRQLSLKGVAEPVTAWSLVWKAEPQPQPRTPGLIATLTRELCENIPIPMFLVDADGVLLYYNEAAEEVFWRSFAEAAGIGPDVWGTLGAEDLDGRPLTLPDLPLAIALNDRRPAHRILRITGFDGVKRTIGVTAIPLFARKDEFVGALAIFWQDAPA